MNLWMHHTRVVKLPAHRFRPARVLFYRAHRLVLHAFHTAHVMMHLLHFRRLKTWTAWHVSGKLFVRLFC